MNLLTALLVVVLILALVGVPNLGFHHYGWAPSGGLGVVVLILIVVLLLRGG